MSNDATLDSFFKILNDNTTAGYHTSAALMSTVFCKDGGVAPNQVQVLGITEHGTPMGPRFVGTLQVAGLFDQLFLSFPDVALTPIAGAQRLYSPAKDIIAVQTDLTGSYQLKWFTKPDPRHSLPLSGLDPVVDPATGLYKAIKIPAVPVFTFATNKVTNLAIYMDRYKFTTSITNLAPAAFERDMSHFLERLSR